MLQASLAAGSTLKTALDSQGSSWCCGDTSYSREVCIDPIRLFRTTEMPRTTPWESLLESHRNPLLPQDMTNRDTPGPSPPPVPDTFKVLPGRFP